MGGAFVLAEFRNKNIQKAAYVSPVTTVAAVDAISSDLQDLDSDSDGLKDWEEVLLGTDSHKADTDGDGTNDGKEAAAGKNPLVKGAGEKKEVAKVTTELTPSDKLARDFFARYMELNKAGLGADKQGTALLVEEVIKNGIVIETPGNFPLSSIKTSIDESTFAIHTYGNQIGEIFKNTIRPAKDEAVITKEALEADDPEILKQLDPIIHYYETILKSLFATPVPESMATMHLDLINATNKFLFVSKSFRQVDNDPIKGIQGTSLYLKAGEALFYAFRNLALHFEAKNVEFKTFEGGSIFTKKP